MLPDLAAGLPAISMAGAHFKAESPTPCNTRSLWKNYRQIFRIPKIRHQSECRFFELAAHPWVPSASLAGSIPKTPVFVRS